MSNYTESKVTALVIIEGQKIFFDSFGKAELREEKIISKMFAICESSKKNKQSVLWRFFAGVADID